MLPYGPWIAFARCFTRNEIIKPMAASPLLVASKAARFLAARRSFAGHPAAAVVSFGSPRSLRTLSVPPIAAAAMEAPSASRFSAASGDGKGREQAFRLSSSSVLRLQKGDITLWFVDGSTDAIVNAANERMLGGGGVDGAIHRAAGPELLMACSKVPEVRLGVRCPTGEARITPAFRLPVSHVIHTVGPIYDIDGQPEVSLRNSYLNSLKVAKENSIEYIAFPAISCGVYRFPFKEASKIALSAVKEFSDAFKEVHFVLFSDELYNIWLESAQELLM